MEKCFRCKLLFSSHELTKKSSGKSFCSVCILHSSYKCEHCGIKFLLGNFAADYEQAKNLAWKVKQEHVKNYHA